MPLITDRLSRLIPTALLLILAALLAPAAPGLAAEGEASILRANLPLAEPVVDADARLAARQATAWSRDGARWLLLEEDVQITIGSFGFKAPQAVVHLQTEQLPGRRIHHLAIYFPTVEAMPGRGAIGAHGERLLVTVSTVGHISLETDLKKNRDASAHPLARTAAGRVHDYLEAVGPGATYRPGGPLTGPWPDDSRVAVDDPPSDTPGDPTDPRPQPGDPTSTAEGPRGPSILPPGGVVSFRAERVVIEPAESGEGSNLLMVGNVRIIYQDDARERSMTLRSGNAVAFLAGDAPAAVAAGGTIESEKITGIYLEESVVASDGDYTVRAPRVYYDPTRNRAVLLEAVFYTWDPNRRLPLYVRAKTLRQHSRNSWTAHKAQLTTSAFAQPHFSIG
ncbi:MAG: hypothetical protein R3336_07360, partial [Phycisphaeraceae bacterium]|nr:hypothetical protein [Phycisphaeraceae bacterium]